MFLLIVWISLGLIMLFVGAELMVRCTGSIIQRFHIPPFIASSILLGAVTSFPELFVSINANIHHEPTLAIGNVLGSNISNILFILGITALIKPISLKQLTNIDFILSIIIATLLVAVMYIKTVNWIMGIIFLSLLILVLILNTLWHIRLSKSKSLKPSHKKPSIRQQPLINEPLKDITSNLEEYKSYGKTLTFIFFILGIIGLLWGSDIILKNIVIVMHSFHLSPYWIGYIALAFGTSLPELGASIVAGYKGNTHMILGNILGSNTFNTLGILGTAMLFHPLTFHSFDHESAFINLACIIGVFYIFYFKKSLNRPMALACIAIYILYIFFTMQ